MKIIKCSFVWSTANIVAYTLVFNRLQILFDIRQVLSVFLAGCNASTEKRTFYDAHMAMGGYTQLPSSLKL